jgi:DNA-binding CsgD family transcriptional regulator
LTQRERELLELIVSGHNDKSAASILGISRHGVDATWRRIFKKLDVHSRIEAILLAYGLRHTTEIRATETRSYRPASSRGIVRSK